jgi:ABC-2 type transport system permease protein
LSALSSALSIWTAFAATSFKQQFAYRMANWSGLFTNAFFLLFRAHALRAAYAARESIGGLNIDDIVSYATVSQALLMVIPQWGRMGISESVRSGQIAMDLSRPVGFFGMHMSRRLGISAYYLLVRFPPVLALGLVFGLLHPPADPSLLPLFLLSVICGTWIANCLLFLVEVSSFWLESDRGVRYGVMGFTNLFSGLILPISFFPDWAQRISRGLPFEYTLYLPIKIYLGQLAGGALLGALSIQLIWALGLALLCETAFAAGTRKLVVHGG